MKILYFAYKMRKNDAERILRTLSDENLNILCWGSQSKEEDWHEQFFGFNFNEAALKQTNNQGLTTIEFFVEYSIEELSNDFELWFSPEVFDCMTYDEDGKLLNGEAYTWETLISDTV